MRPFLLIFFWLLGLLPLSPAMAAASAAAEAPPETLDWAAIGHSVVRVVVRNDQGMSTGTAFPVDDAHHFVTNHHVIDGALQGGDLQVIESVDPVRLRPARVVWSSQDKDLAIIEVPGFDRPALPLAEEADVKQADPVYSYGYPGASDHGPENLVSPTIKRGVISARRRFALHDDDGAAKTEMFEHDATVNSGNSGGPLFDACGRVIGVNESKATTEISAEAIQNRRLNIQEGTFFAVRVSELRRALDAQGIHYQIDTEACVPDRGVTPVVKPIPWGWLGVAAGLLLLTLLIAYRRLHQRLRQGLADGARVDTHVLSRLIRERIGRYRGGDARPSPLPRGAARHTEVMDRRAGPDGRQTVVMGADRRVGARRKTEVIAHRLLPDGWSGPDIAIGATDQVLGRDPNQVDVVIDDPAVSRRHLRLSRRGGQVWVEDLGSANGSFIDDQRLAPGRPQRLPPGARLRLGNSRVVYRLE